MSLSQLIEIYFIFCCIHVICYEKTTYEKVPYFSTEHPKVTYIDQKYIKYANVTSKRYSRSDPFYYISVHINVLVPLDNKLKLHYYFLEFLTNVYKRSFVEVHFTWCDLIERDQFIGQFMRQGPLSKPCPHPPGEYHLYNMSIPADMTPKNFPFKKGRILVNLTNEYETIASAYIDLEIKEFKRKISTKSNFKADHTT